MKVCLTARLRSGSGGVEQVVSGLASGLSSLSENTDEFLFWSILGGDSWLRPHIAGQCRVVSTESRPAQSAFRRSIKRVVPLSQRVLDKVPAISKLRRPQPGFSDGTVENLGTDVVHFTTPGAFLTELPSIYQPHDLLHVHHPQFLSRRECEFREASYRTHCERAGFVVAMTTWGKRDLVQHFELPPEKVTVIPWAPAPFAGIPMLDREVAEVVARFSLPDRFIFFPAHSWPHKNHIGLLEALDMLKRKHKLSIPLVCTGTMNEHFPRIAARARQLRIDDQVKFLGYVSTRELEGIYRQAHALIFPSHFEGWGMPICEAFAAGLPVACSDATSLPDLAGDAALLFDPSNAASIAEGIGAVWEDTELRQSLIYRGRQRVEQFSWQRTARSMRILYRQVTGMPLTPEDQVLLAEPSLV